MNKFLWSILLWIGCIYAWEIDVAQPLRIMHDGKPVLEEIGFSKPDARVVEISVQNVASGLTVPIKYIQYSNGVPYVYIKSDYGYTPIAVYIAGSDGENAIISARDEKLTLFAGLRYRMPIEEDDDE